MTDKPPPKDETPEERFGRAIKNALATPHKPHKETGHGVDGKRTRKSRAQ
jgi:hypothetical protein